MNKSEKISRNGVRLITSLDKREIQRLRLRYESKKESLNKVARAFCISTTALKKFGLVNGWKQKSGSPKVYAYEKP